MAHFVGGFAEDAAMTAAAFSRPRSSMRFLFFSILQRQPAAVGRGGGGLLFAVKTAELAEKEHVASRRLIRTAAVWTSRMRKLSVPRPP